MPQGPSIGNHAGRKGAPSEEEAGVVNDEWPYEPGCSCLPLSRRRQENGAQVCAVSGDVPRESISPARRTGLLFYRFQMPQIPYFPRQPENVAGIEPEEGGGKNVGLQGRNIVIQLRAPGGG